MTEPGFADVLRDFTAQFAAVEDSPPKPAPPVTWAHPDHEGQEL